MERACQAVRLAVLGHVAAVIAFSLGHACVVSQVSYLLCYQPLGEKIHSMIWPDTANPAHAEGRSSDLARYRHLVISVVRVPATTPVRPLPAELVAGL